MEQFSILAKVKLDATAQELQTQLDKHSKSMHVKVPAADTQDFEMSISVANAIMREFIDIAKSMVDQVYELDDAITEFKKVSDLRGSGLEEYVNTLGELGQTTARTTSEMVEAATMFRKSGFSDEDAATLAQVATMYQNIADTEVSASAAAASIVSQLQAFGRESMEPIHIIDAYNEV